MGPPFAYIILVISKSDTEVNGTFKTLDVYIKEFDDMNSDDAKAYTSRLITEVGIYLIYLTFLAQH